MQRHSFPATLRIAIAVFLLVACGGTDERLGSTAAGGAAGKLGTGGTSTGGSDAAGPADDASAPVNELVACSRNSECAVYPRPSTCNVVPMGISADSSAVALNKLHIMDYNTECGCPQCDPDANYELDVGGYVATCDNGTCRLVDLGTDPVNRCFDPPSTWRTCRLRTNDCCECGPFEPSELTAVLEDDSAFEALVCDPGQTCDPNCDGNYGSWSSTLQVYCFGNCAFKGR